MVDCVGYFSRFPYLLTFTRWWPELKAIAHFRAINNDTNFFTAKTDNNQLSIKLVN